MRTTVAAMVCVLTLACMTAGVCLCQAPASRPAPPAQPGEFPVPEGVKAIRNVEYAKVGGKSLKLDVFVPADAGRPLPLVVWIHGGGWHGDKDAKGECWVMPLARRGYVVANINYRTSDEAIFPAQTDDCKAAIRFLRAHAGDYSIDPDRIGVSGASAGGHLAAFLGVTGDMKEVEGKTGDCLDQSSRVQAVVDFAGPADFPLFIKTINSDPLTKRNAGEPVKGLLGGLDDKVADLAVKASPVTYARKDAAPFLIIHGENDKTVPPSQAKSLYDALKAKGADATIYIVAGSGHVFGLQGADTLDMAYSFFDKHLKKAASATRPADSPASRPAANASAAPVAPPPADSAAGPYRLEFSTFIGGKKWDMCRGLCADAEGNLYVTGGTGSEDFPTTPGTLCQKYQGGPCNALVAKFNPAGRLVWSTLLGGHGYDRAYTAKVDKKGFVYVSGRAGRGFPTTPGAFQPAFQGCAPEAVYGPENGFVAKLTPDGAKIVWASYVGSGVECRDMDLDADGNIYLTLPWDSQSKFTLPESWFANAYQKTPHGQRDCGVIKIANDGAKVLWATFIGGSKGSSQDNSLCVGADRCPVFFLGTQSQDMPMTPGTFRQGAAAGPWLSWLGKLSADGSKLIFGLYIGDGTLPRTHAVQQDAQGNIFVGLSVTKWPVTPGAFQAKFGGGKVDFGVAKFSPAGALLAATFLGGGGDEFNGPDTVFVDGKGNVVVAGYSSSADYPVTPGAFQPRCGGQFDGVVSILSNDLGRLVYSTHMGGGSNDNLRAACVAPDGALCVAGASGSPNWPTKNAFQAALAAPVHAPDAQDWGSGNIVVARFSPAQPASAPTSATPRP